MTSPFLTHTIYIFFQVDDNSINKLNCKENHTDQALLSRPELSDTDSVNTRGLSPKPRMVRMEKLVARSLTFRHIGATFR